MKIKMEKIESIIMKFGGTSIACPDKVAQIVNAKHGKRLIVLSACSGITDKLTLLAESASRNDSLLKSHILNEIRDYHIELCRSLFADQHQSIEIQNAVLAMFMELASLSDGIQLLSELTPKMLNSVLSYGEILSSTIFYQYMISLGKQCKLFDARQSIQCNTEEFFKNNDLDAIQVNTDDIIAGFKDYDIIITQGFLASDFEGRTTTLGRGGSDLSATLFGAALDSTEIEIWTDVPGILSADPRIIPHASLVEKMSFDEVKQLSFFGAKVVHPDTIKPAMAKGIPVRVLSTFSPEINGTLITDNTDSTMAKVNSLLLRSNCLLISFQSQQTVDLKNAYNNFYDACSQSNIKILYTSISGSKAQFILDCSANVDIVTGFSNGLNFSEPEFVDLICLCGENLHCNVYSKTAGLNSIINQIYDSAPDSFPISIKSGMLGNTIILTAPPLLGISVLNILHDRIIEPKGSSEPAD